MTISAARGAKKKCDDLARQIVHARRYCLNCGTTSNPNAAHIIGRSYSTTRTDLDNLLLLCASCHDRFHRFPDEWMAFVDAEIGRDEYDRLKRKAEAGVRKRFDWDAELERLTGVWNDMEEAA